MIDNRGQNALPCRALERRPLGCARAHAVGSNAVLAAAGYNFALLIRWFEALWRALFRAFITTAPTLQQK